jgi:NADH-quinone oxidoreductase subunit J
MERKPTIVKRLKTLVIGGKHLITGAHSSTGALDNGEPNINVLARALFSRYVFAFEVTSILILVAMVGAVVLARREGPR